MSIIYCKCPACGGQVVTGGGCWACLYCGAEGCGRLEVDKDAKTQPGGSAYPTRRAKIKTLQVPS